MEDVLEQNRKLHAVIIALEEENASCKQLLDETTDLVVTLQVYNIYVYITIVYKYSSIRNCKQCLYPTSRLYDHNSNTQASISNY